jgi:hypothetical protein
MHLVSKTLNSNPFLIGATKFYENVKDLIGFYPGIFWKISWLVLTPGLCLV